MDSRRTWAIAVLASSALCLSPLPALAWNLDFVSHGLKLTTFLVEKVEYDSNLFLDHDDPTSDGVLRTAPGLLFEYSVGPVALALGYKIERLTYFDHRELDATHHAGLLDVLYESPAGLRLELKDDYLRTTDQQTEEQRTRRESMTNRVRASAEYQLRDRWSLGVAYDNTRIFYDGEEDAADEELSLLSRWEHAVSVTAFWRFLPKSTLLVRYAFGWADFDEGQRRDLTRHVAEVGVRGDLTPRLSTTFRVGVEHRQPRSDALDAYTGVIVGGDWTYLLLPATRLILAVDRRAAESFTVENRFYVTSSATLSAVHEFATKLKARVGARLGRSEYLNKAEDTSGAVKWRSDLYVGASLGVAYDIRPWLQVGADYWYARRQSNFRESSYDVHRLGGTLTLQF